MNTHTALHAVSNTGAHRERPRTEHPGFLVAGAGAPVVLLHSSLSSKAQWIALAARLAPRFRVIALDLCGYGDNALPSAPASFTLDDEVRLVGDHIDRLVAPHVRVHVVGHSYGGLVAMRFAERSRGRVASLTLYEPVAFSMLDRDDKTLKEVRQMAACLPGLIAAGLRLQAAQVFVDFWSGAGTYGRLPRPAQLAVARNIGKVPLDFQAALSWPTDADGVRSIATPALLLCGNHSPAIARAIVQRLTHSLPNRYVGRIDAGHMGPVTTPDLVNPWIEAFIDMRAERDVGATAPSAPDVFAAFPSAAD